MGGIPPLPLAMYPGQGGGTAPVGNCITAGKDEGEALGIPEGIAIGVTVVVGAVVEPGVPGSCDEDDDGKAATGDDVGDLVREDEGDCATDIVSDGVGSGIGEPETLGDAPSVSHGHMLMRCDVPSETFDTSPMLGHRLSPCSHTRDWFVLSGLTSHSLHTPGGEGVRPLSWSTWAL